MTSVAYVRADPAERVHVGARTVGAAGNLAPAQTLKVEVSVSLGDDLAAEACDRGLGNRAHAPIFCPGCDISAQVGRGFARVQKKLSTATPTGTVGAGPAGTIWCMAPHLGVYEMMRNPVAIPVHYGGRLACGYPQRAYSGLPLGTCIGRYAVRDGIRAPRYGSEGVCKARAPERGLFAIAPPYQLVRPHEVLDAAYGDEAARIAGGTECPLFEGTPPEGVGR